MASEMFHYDEAMTDLVLAACRDACPWTRSPSTSAGSSNRSMPNWLG